MNKIYALFGFDPHHHKVRTELMAGLTTFLTMSYILAVNPIILSNAGMDKGALFTATVVSAMAGTLVMALYAKMPFAQASSMGLNALFAYTLVQAMGYSWQEALAAVFIEGVAFIILTLFKVRETIVNSIPVNLRHSISVGIGMFIPFIGLRSSGLIVSDDTLIVSMGAWNATTLISAAGILLGAVLMALKVRGALFYTIIAMTLIGIPLGVTHMPHDFSIISMPASLEPIAFKLDFSRFLTFDIDYYIVVFALLFMDLFNTLGTLIGAATGAKMVNLKTGEIPHLNEALMADAVGTAVGALCGTSTVTTYVESATGIMAGGRTGLTAFTVAMLFFLSLFFSPLFLMIPSAATTSALVLVGMMMLQSVRYIDFHDVTETMPCFITMIMMPFTGSISEGIVLGLLSYVIVKLCSGRHKDLTPTICILAAFFLLKYVVLFF